MRHVGLFLFGFAALAWAGSWYDDRNAVAGEPSLPNDVDNVTAMR